MKLSSLPVVLTFLSAISATNAFTKRQDSSNVVRLMSPDGSVKANFIPTGATVTNFWVKDKFGKFRDIILGFDNFTDYTSDVLGHPYFGPVVGRYANRIKNGTFTLPSSPGSSNVTTFHIPENEHNGTDTLHGGFDGYDRRLWTVAKQTLSSVTFTLIDPDGTQGFPGTVQATVRYTLKNKGTWNIQLNATATKRTPIMLSGHHYWNLEAYKESQDLSAHFAQFKASRIVATDGILVPNGNITNITGTPADFSSAKSIGAAINQTTPSEFCGTGCTGFDNCWIYDDPTNTKTPQLSVWSTNSGIRLDVSTNQPALQIYTCNGINPPGAPIPRKAAQGGSGTIYDNHSCVVIEQESLIDAINNPGFGVDQIYGPGRSYFWDSTYRFSVMK